MPGQSEPRPLLFIRSIAQNTCLMRMYALFIHASALGLSHSKGLKDL